MSHIDLDTIDKDTLDGFCEYFLSFAARIFQQPEIQAAYREWHIRKYGRPPSEDANP